jgi:hypothetical protein
VSRTILVPDWGANEEMQQLREKRSGLELYQGSMRGYALQFEERFGCDVIVIDGRPHEIPERLEVVPMEYISIIQNNAPYRGLHDGWYKEDVEVPGTDGHRFTAQVETYYRGSVLQHSIRGAAGRTTFGDLHRGHRGGTQAARLDVREGFQRTRQG